MSPQKAGRADLPARVFAGNLDGMSPLFEQDQHRMLVERCLFDGIETEMLCTSIVDSVEGDPFGRFFHSVCPRLNC